MPKKKETKISKGSHLPESMGQAEVEPMAEPSEGDWPSCVFSVDDDGRPTVTCPDIEAQQEAVMALEDNEVVVRVRVKAEEP